MAKVAILLIKAYQKGLSPLLGQHCRFYPSCSNYAIESFQRYGFIRGIILTIWRILRCQPFCKGGYDPVPLEFLSCKKHHSYKSPLS
ncbi:MAG TPA: membrane protein insertion efficiency factor YidD [Candidatus Hydrogenedens sp.]|nr:membrane protein insertion efficiency factor YidD [Candidatus Hydrogenedens sp.]HOK08917.1 membrane protein insertion efficiency factor YidD [Candidatus Hydrogenedens sp.]HOL19596.1 membrane protein insertion efficiency factor YidD [Candidatus Hydrogenedens sp.]HPP58878.1 membrane protein insertion efficiency factor YidD [Candidatus Hydrogenedens sp.]